MIENKTEEANLELLIGALHKTAIISMTDCRGTIIMVNQKFCTITGYSESELIGANHRVINSGHHSKDFFADMWRTILAGQTWTGEVCNRRKDGSLYWVDSTILPVGSENRRQFLSIRYDITARKAAEQKMIQSAKMTSLGEMAAGMAHEINNPIAIIAGKLGQIKREFGKPSINTSLVLENIKKIDAALARVTQTVDNLFKFSRDSALDPFVKQSIRTIINDSLSMCRARLESKGIDIRVSQFPEIHCEVRGNQISQILVNLLDNAFDAIQSHKNPWIAIDVASTSANRVRISLTDSGNGIPATIASRMMEPFFTTKPVGKGTGLGLSISKGLAEAHGGSLTLDSEAKNTCFILELPISSS